MVMSSDYSSTGPGFYSQHSRSGLKPSVTPRSVTLTPFSGLYGKGMHTMHRHTCVQNTHTHQINILKVLANLWKIFIEQVRSRRNKQ